MEATMRCLQSTEYLTTCPYYVKKERSRLNRLGQDFLYFCGGKGNPFVIVHIIHIYVTNSDEL